MQDIFICFMKNVICKRKQGRVTMVQGKRIREYRVWGWSTMEMETRGQGSAWKSSPKTEKRLRPDWTKTAQDWKFRGPPKTATAVRSSVSHNFRNLKTDKRPV